MAETFFELRLYEVEPGRMRDMVTRFEGPLQGLFRTHGIRVIGAWHTTAGPRSPLFVYLMQWDSMHARDQAWGGFYADPQWHQVRTDTNRGSELVERYDLNFLKEVLPWRGVALCDDGCLELYMPRVAVGCGTQARQLMAEQAAALLQPYGATVVAAYECMTGDDLPRACLLLSWPSHEQRQAGLACLEQPPLGRADRHLLHPLLPDR